AADVVVQQRGDVAFAEVGDDGDHELAGVLRAGGNLQGTPDGGAGGDPTQDTLLGAQIAGRGHGVLDRGVEHLVVDLGVQHLRDEVRAEALDLVRAGVAAVEDGRILRLDG